MKFVFAGAFGLLVLLSVVAWALRPAPPDGRIPLVWVTDPSPARQEQLDLFNRLHSGYELRLDPSNLEMQKVIVQSIGGVGPDLFTAYDNFGLSAAVKAGIAWDVTDALTSAGIDFSRDVWNAARQTFMYEGRIYGFPGNAATDAVWFHRDLFDEAGIPYPEGPMTWEEFLPIARRLTVRDERGRAKQYGFLFDPAAHWLQFVMQWGGSFYTPDGTRCTLDSPEAIAAATFMHDLIFRHRVTPSVTELNAMATQGGWGMNDISFLGGKRVAMALGGRWWLSSLRQYKGLRLGVFECPHAARRVFRGYGKSIIINRHSPRREAALEVFRYLAGRPYNELINDQADALAPMKRFCEGPRFLHNPAYPEEDYNHVWRSVMEHTEPEQVSPFVNGQIVARIMARQFDMFKTGQKSPEETMRSITREVNAEIRRTLEINPELRARWERLTGQKAEAGG